MCSHIAKEAEADVLAPAVERSCVRGVFDEWGMEDIAAEEEIVEPCAAGSGGHDLARVGNAIRFSEAFGFLGLADVLAIGVVEGQGDTPDIFCKAF